MLETVAPTGLALSYDNVGLLIGTEREIRRVLVALDCTPKVANEAIEKDVDLVLTHHPLFFHPVKRILPDDPDTAVAYRLIRHGVGLYAAHTNLDACAGGVNDALCELLGLVDPVPLSEDGIGRVGTTDAPIPFSDFVRKCERALGTRVRFAGDPNRTVRKVAVVGGAGGDLVDSAAATGCDAFVTGEMKHHEAIRADYYGLPRIEAGHYETECVVLKKWISRLQEFNNDVKYDHTETERSPLTTREEETI